MRYSEQRIIPPADPRYWQGVVFMQGDDADAPLDLLWEEGTDAAFEHLLQWDYEREGDVRQAPWGRGDHLQEFERHGETFALTWNDGLHYIGLSVHGS